MKLEHKALGTWDIVDELTQLQIEAIFQALTDSGKRGDTAPKRNRHIVEAAIEGNVFKEKPELKPKEITFLARELLGMATEAMMIPEEEVKN